MEKLEYLRQFIEYNNEVLKDLDVNDRDRDDIQPPVEPEMGNLLSFFIKLTNAKRVLELGSGIAYSTIWLGQALKENGGKLITIDNHPRVHSEVVNNIEKAGLNDTVEIMFGNAEDLINEVEGPFDIIFQDCGKALYPKLLDKIINLTKKNGLIIADDVLFKVEKDVRKNLGKYTDEYNKLIFAREDLSSSVLPVGHGLSLSIKL